MWLMSTVLLLQPHLAQSPLPLHLLLTVLVPPPLPPQLLKPLAPLRS
jgi:hypothetical protein